MTLIMQIESARGELLNTIQTIQKKYNFPAFILDGIISQLLSEIRAEEKIELINASNQLTQKLEKDKGEGEKKDG